MTNLFRPDPLPKKRLGTDHSWDPSHDQPSKGDRELLRAGFTFIIEIWLWGKAAGQFLEGRGPRSRRARGGAGLGAAALRTAQRGSSLAVPRLDFAVAAVSEGQLLSPCPVAGADSPKKITVWGSGYGVRKRSK